MAVYHTSLLKRIVSYPELTEGILFKMDDYYFFKADKNNHCSLKMKTLFGKAGFTVLIMLTPHSPIRNK